MQPKCSRKERRCGFSNHRWIHVRETLCVSRPKQKHFIWPSESRCIKESLRFLTTEQQRIMDDSFVNLGEEVILTLLWQSGASESATVYFVINLSICYWLFKCGVLSVVCVCVCVRERERVTAAASCVCARERERERVAASCVCVKERQVHNRCLFANT